MRITFVLPGSSRLPVGGYKVVYEYANRLSSRGHTVTVVHPAMLDESVSIEEKAYHLGRYALWRVTDSFGPSTWFSVLPNVKMSWVRTLREEDIPIGDVIVATGWPTAEYVAGYSASKGRKFYLLQHYETWWGPEERVRATWQLPLQKIVISKWLLGIAHELGQGATYIPNGLDFESFGCDVPICERVKPKVLMLYHEMEWKGSQDGIQAVGIARETIPEISLTLFGRFPVPTELPSWASYIRNPPQAEIRTLYNNATVFLAPSWTEGWDLPACEAMICGAALVCTDIDGHREYAVCGRNALTAPAKAPREIAEALIEMLTNRTLRQRLAEAAKADVAQFTWDKAVTSFEQVVSS